MMPSSCASVAPALWNTRPSASSRMPGTPSAKKWASDCGIEASIASIDMRSRPVPANSAAGSNPNETSSRSGLTRRAVRSCTSQSIEARLCGCTSSLRCVRISGTSRSAAASASALAGRPLPNALGAPSNTMASPSAPEARSSSAWALALSGEGSSMRWMNFGRTRRAASERPSGASGEGAAC